MSNYTKEIENKILKEKCNKMIFSNEYYEKHFSHIPEATFYKVLERLVKKKSLCRLSKGIYYVPKKTEIGIVPISDDEIARYFTKSNNGVFVGYELFNRKKITTQVGNHYEIYTTRIEEDKKTIGNVKLKKLYFKPTENEFRIIEAFEILKEYGHIEDENDYALLHYFSENRSIFTIKDVNNVIKKMKYGKSVIAFLEYILNYLGIINNLNEHLSVLSDYKFYKIKVIGNEIA